jgi:VanZ family protein
MIPAHASRRILWIITICYWVILFAVTHTPRAPVVPGLKLSDKLMHAGAYFILAGMLYLTLWKTWPDCTIVWWVIALVLAYGVLDEQTQKLVGRDCELADWLADAGGGIAAMLILVSVRIASRKT